MEFKLAQIAKLIDGQLIGDENIKITNLHGLENALSGSLSFYLIQSTKSISTQPKHLLL